MLRFRVCWMHKQWHRALWRVTTNQTVLSWHTIKYVVVYFKTESDIWCQIKLSLEAHAARSWTTQPTTDLDGSLSIGQRCLQPVGLVSVLSGLLLSLLQFTPQFGQWALQGRFLSLELFAQLNLHCKHTKTCSQLLKSYIRLRTTNGA